MISVKQEVRETQVAPDNCFAFLPSNTLQKHNGIFYIIPQHSTLFYLFDFCISIWAFLCAEAQRMKYQIKYSENNGKVFYTECNQSVEKCIGFNPIEQFVL